MMTRERIYVHIRWMIRRDMPEVQHIEDASYDLGWTEEDFLRCLRNRNCIGMVAERGDEVLGYMLYTLHDTRIHILNFSVHPQCRRQDVGTQMLAKMVGKLSSHRRNRITLEVRETNLAAQLFFRAQGFQAVRVLREHYEDTNEAAYRFAYRLREDYREST